MDLVQKLEDFLRKFYYIELQKAVADEIGTIVVDFSLLDKFDHFVSDQLLEMPDHVLEAFQEAVKNSIPESKINVRVRNLPESRYIRIRDLRAEHLNRFMCFDALIKSASEVKPQIYEAIFECPECGTHISVPQTGNLLQKATVCECGRRGDFKLIEKKMFDMRWLTGVEPFELTEGEQPGEIPIFLKEDLTIPKKQKKTDPGNRLKITGMMKEMPKWIKGKLSTKLDTYIDANYFESSDMEFDELDITAGNEEKIREMSEDPMIFEKLVASIAPGIYGYDEIKESIVLQLFGGVPRRLPDGSRIRDNIHILLTGDPGIGKSQMLKLVSTIVPRGKYVSGKGVTGSGLCTTYDSVVFLRDGTMTKIGTLVESKFKGNEEKSSNGIISIDGDGTDILSFDENDIKLKPMKITKYWKIPSPKNLVEIRTRRGKSVVVTMDNPVPVLEGGKITWKSAKDIRKNDFIVTAKNDNSIINSEIFWDKVAETNIINSKYDYVYDLTVENSHSFLANGIIIHNTATVVKNEVLGGWVLEAGAMVLTNKSVISIDEFDKMNKDDQIAMHEAMSVGTVSIAKASIVATLPAQTSVLAAANPKLGRFDPYVPITDQIEIPETLLSRFDLKFALRDRPDKIMDERLADHIITARTTPKLVEPVLNPIMLRKYIAYARKIDKLELLPEASQKLKDFYVDMRTKHITEDTPTVSITLRQYEALIRLAEASAKIRLDNKVTLNDAQRAIKLMKYSLTQLGYDYETGRIDIDRIESGISSSRRSKIRQIMDIVDRLQKESGKDVAIEDVRAEAQNQGIEGVDEIIEKLKNEGMVFQPRSGFLRKV
ncbi:MAG: ATP-binding protein [Candidatus Aenigmarchaeota archaeon]|nr:ATP-binding protein [Candidatus Aenigmarchaeota archaeon]